MKYTTIIAIDPDTEKSGVALLDLKRNEVEKKLSGWQKAMMAGGYVLLGAAVLLVVLGILRWRKIL